MQLGVESVQLVERRVQRARVRRARMLPAEQLTQEEAGERHVHHDSLRSRIV